MCNTSSKLLKNRNGVVVGVGCGCVKKYIYRAIFVKVYDIQLVVVSKHKKLEISIKNMIYVHI